MDQQTRCIEFLTNLVYFKVILIIGGVQMNKSGFWKVLLGIVAIALIGSLTSCDLLGDDDNGSSRGGRGTGELEYQGETTELTQLFFDDWGEDTPGVYNIDIYILSDDLTLSGDIFLDTSGTGRYVYLEMFFDGPSVSAGDYTFAVSEAAGTFSDFSDITTVVDGNPTAQHDLTDGNVTISINGSTYTIIGSVTTEAGDSATFTYEGPLTGSF